MSPEQATGDQALGPPSDVYALGCVLYEMLLGEPPHVGRSAQAVLGKIITSVPTPPAKGRPSVPAHVDAAVRRALEKVPADRFASAHDFAVALDDPTFRHGDHDVVVAARSSMAWKRATLVLGASLAVSLVALGAVWSAARAPRAQPVVRSAFNLPPGDELSDRNGFAPPLAVSPDGLHVVYVGRREGVDQLFERPVGSEDPRPLAGTEGANGPFFSPDGQWVGFFADGALKKVPLSGGLPISICPAPAPHGAVWAETDTVYFSMHASSIWKVSAQGGTPEIVTTHDSIGGIIDDVQPEVLPGGRVILFTRNTNQPTTSWVAVRDLDTGEQHDLVNGWTPRYVPTGHIVYSRGGSLWAVGFDADRLETVGQPNEILDGLWTTLDGADPFAVSPSGMLVFARQPGAAASEVVRVDSTGAPSTLFSAADVVMPRVSPDGGRVAAWIQGNLWVVDLARLTRTRLTHDELTGGTTPYAWTPDSRFLTFFNSARGGIDRVVADGSSGPAPLLQTSPTRFPTSWSSDGRALALYGVSPETQRDLWTWDVGMPEPTPFLVTPFQERMPRFSPDGQWLAYVSDESGRDEVYLRPYPGPEGKVTISVDGGTEPAWSADGRRLFYRSGPRLVVVDLAAQPGLSVGAPRLLFENDRYVLDLSPARAVSNYDVLPDGLGFVMILRGGSPTRIEVVQNWHQELTALIPVG
jgi:serine/threonine-protein kinase